MNDSKDAKKQTSRRRFAKTAASALVAMPVIASLSSCGKKPAPPEPPPPGGSPTPTPSGSPRIDFERGSNPPIIIDGGSLSISLDTRLEQENTGVPPRPWKLTQRDIRYGKITAVRLMNEIGESVRPAQPTDFPVGAADALELRIWLQAAGPENAAGEVTYDSPVEHFLLTNTGVNQTFEIRYVDRIDDKGKGYKKARPHRKYRNDKIKATSKDFRIGKVQIKIAGVVVAEESSAENGFRIVVFMKDA